jgi:hypothetical protein
MKKDPKNELKTHQLEMYRLLLSYGADPIREERIYYYGQSL